MSVMLIPVTSRQHCIQTQALGLVSRAQRRINCDRKGESLRKFDGKTVQINQRRYMRLRGTISVVTGGARGMGTELARTFVSASTEGVMTDFAPARGLNGSKSRTIV